MGGFLVVAVGVNETLDTTFFLLFSYCIYFKKKKMYRYYYSHNKSNAWSKVLSEKRKFLIVNIRTSVTNSVSAVLSLCFVISVVYYTYYTKTSESLGIPL